MKKLVPIVIAVVFILSIVYVSYFGMSVYYGDFTVKAENITITNTACANPIWSDEIPMSDIIVENQKMKGIDVVYVHNQENKINLAFKIEPDNTTSRTVTFTTTRAYALKDDSNEDLTDADRMYDIVYKQTYNTVEMWLIKNVGAFVAKITMNDSGGKYCQLHVGVWEADEDPDFLPEFWRDKVMLN